MRRKCGRWGSIALDLSRRQPVGVDGSAGGGWRVGGVGRRSAVGGQAGIVRIMSLLPDPGSRTMGRMSRRVVFVVYPRITALDLVGPHEVFGAVRAAYDIVVAGAEAGPIATTRGPGHRRRPFARLGPRARSTRSSSSAAKARSRPRATRSSCARSRTSPAGAGASRRCAPARSSSPPPGLLDGKRRDDALVGVRPAGASGTRRSTVESDRIFVQDGNVWTSAGVTAGMDLALALVADDMGQDVARAVARQLVMYVQRPGGQAQFSAQLSAQRAARDPLRELQGWIGEHPGRGPQCRAARGTGRDESAPLRPGVPRRRRLHARRVRRAGAGRGRAPAARDHRALASTRSRPPPDSARPRPCGARSRRRVGAEPAPSTEIVSVPSQPA